MDYRYYQGDRPKVYQKYQKYIHLLRYLGTGMLVLSVAIPFLITTRVIGANYSLNVLASIFMVLGPMLILIGVAWNNFIDRG